MEQTSQVPPQPLTEETSPLTGRDVLWLNIRVSLYTVVAFVPMYLTVFPPPDAVFLGALLLGFLAIVRGVRLLLQVWPASRRLRYEGTVLVDSLTGKWRSLGLLRKPTPAYRAYRRALLAECEKLALNPTLQEAVLLHVAKDAAHRYTFTVAKRVTLGKRVLPPTA
jgi:hypothetical protein